MFVSSSRLLSREKIVLRDPMLGRSLLVGLIAAGVGFLVLGPFAHWLTVRFFSDTAPAPFGIPLWMLSGATNVLAQVTGVFSSAILSVILVAALVLIQRWVGRKWLAVGLGILMWTLIEGFSSGQGFVLALLNSALTMFVLLRWGVLAMVMMRIYTQFAWLARATDYEHWTSQGAILVICVVSASAGFGVWAACGRGSAAKPVAGGVPR
jgi:hypothetical protein